MTAPSLLISRKARARRARLQPNRPNPARAARKFALSGATDFSCVIDQMHDALQGLSFEQRRDGHLQIERALLQRPIREGGCMKMSLRPVPRAQRPEH